MTITKKSGRQEVIAATADFTFADVADDTYMPAVDLPSGAIVVGGHLAITTIFNSGTDDKFSIGDKVGSAAATKDTYAALSADITQQALCPSWLPARSTVSPAPWVWSGTELEQPLRLVLAA